MSTAKVFVGSLPPGCKPEELRRLFTSYGVVVECDIMNRCGFVHLETIEMAEAAIAALNGTEFKGQAIVVEPGRPKDRRGGSGGGGGGGGAGNRRPMQGGHTGGNFSRGGHTSGNHFRGEGGGRSGNRTSNSNSDSHFGPMRSEGNFRQQRSAPYSKSLPQQNQSQSQFDGHPQTFRNKFNQGGGNMSHNDYHGGAGSSGSQRGPRSSNNIGQDRRGFALPAVEQQQQQMSFGSKQGRFGNGSMVQSRSNTDHGMFQGNRSNPGMNSGSAQGGRGGFNANRGGFGGRGGGFNSRRGGGNGQSSSVSQNHSGSFNKQGSTNGQHHNAPNSYQSEFPPLGSHGGSTPGNRNRFNGPRPSPHMGGNRRF